MLCKVRKIVRCLVMFESSPGKAMHAHTFLVHGRMHCLYGAFLLLVGQAFVMDHQCRLEQFLKTIFNVVLQHRLTFGLYLESGE